MRLPRVAETAWCWRTRSLPSNSTLTTMPVKCTPSSPSIRTNSQGRPAPIRRSISFASNMQTPRSWADSAAQLVAAGQHGERQRGQEGAAAARHNQADPGRRIRSAEESITKAINHEEKWVEMGDPLPERRQGMNGIEDPGQHREGHHDEVLEVQIGR